MAAGARVTDLATGPTRHEPALDGLRALAALVVLLFHARVPGFAHGAIGVDVFFTLSGFLITALLMGTLARHGRIDYRVFYTRRALRLMPAYVAVVLAAVAADLVVDSGGTLKGALFSATYVANWAVGGLGAGLGALGHTWSLSIEEQFYLVWPLLLAVVVRACRGRLSSLRRVLAALVLGSWALSAALLLAGSSTQLVYNATPTRAVQLLAGALLAAVVLGRRADEPHRPSRVAGPAGWTAVALLLALASWDAMGPTAEILVGWPVIAALTCVVIATTTGVRAEGRSLRRVLSSGPLVAVGVRSYGLYLWHFPIFTSIDAAVGLETWPPRLLGMALTAVVVPLSYRFVEQPFLRLKDRVPATLSATTTLRPAAASSAG